MKLEKAIEQLEFDRTMILFDPTTGEEIMPEILKALNEDNYRTYIADGVAIEALKEVQQYRAIGTVEECREAVEKQKAKEPKIHKERFSNTYNCPKCGYVLIHRDETGWFCGQYYKFCPECGQAIQQEQLN